MRYEGMAARAEADRAAPCWLLRCRCSCSLMALARSCSSWDSEAGGRTALACLLGVQRARRGSQRPLCRIKTVLQCNNVPLKILVVGLQGRQLRGRG